MRLYDLFLLFYPAAYRAEYGEEMRRVFEQRLLEQPPRLGVLGNVGAALADVIPNAAAIHAEYLRADLLRVARMFRRTPFVLCGAVAVLAIGVGANAAVFGVLNAILVKPLPYRDPQGVVMIWRMPRSPVPPNLTVTFGTRTVRKADNRTIMTGNAINDLRQGAPGILSDVAAINLWQGNLEAQFDLPLADRVQRLRGALVTPNFFTMLGVRPCLGRLFDSSDESSTQAALVLSHALWQQEFGGDPRVLGRAITMQVGRPRAPRTFIVVGVLEKDFRFTYPEETEAWTILPWPAIPVGAGRQAVAYRAVGRLAPGITIDQAKARLAALQTPSDPPPPSAPGAPPHVSYWPDPVADWVAADVRPQLLLLGAVALLLLLVTCMTVANVIFVRAAARDTELALRSALGANRGQLLRQLLTEGAALSTIGAALGILVSIVASPLVRSLIPETMPRGDEFSLRSSLLLFTGGLAFGTTMLAALAPLRRATRVDLLAGLSGRSSSAPGRGATWLSRQRILGAQAAMATALLTSAALLLASFWRLSHVPLGFDGERVLTVEMRLLDPKYRDSTVRASLQDALTSRLRAVPGVLEVGLTSAVPFRGVDFGARFNRPGNQEVVPARERYVDSSYFDVMRIQLVRGRLFAAADGPSRPRVVVISESFARSLFSAVDPIGRTIDSIPTEVIGIVRDVRYKAYDQEAEPAVYFARAQSPSELVCVVARIALPFAGVAKDILKAVHDVDPNIPAMNVTTVDQIVQQSISGRRFYTVATLAFAAIGLILTVTGLATIVARAVVNRRRELAIRAALGADSRRLVSLVAREGVVPVAIGCAIGLAISIFGAPLLNAFLFQTPAHDLLATVAVPVGLVLVAAVAAATAGLGVLRVSPATALQSN